MRKCNRSRTYNWDYAICTQPFLKSNGLIESIEFSRLYLEDILFVKNSEFLVYLTMDLCRIFPSIHSIKQKAYSKNSNLKNNLEHVQQYYDEIFGNLRIFVFGYNRRRLFYTPYNPKHTRNICIYMDQRKRFIPILDVGKFFNKASKNYCLECNRYYEGAYCT